MMRFDNSRRKKLRTLGLYVYWGITGFFSIISVYAIFKAFVTACKCCYVDSVVDNLNDYGETFGLTLGLISVYFILRQIRIAQDANRIISRQEWMKYLDEFLTNDSNIGNYSKEYFRSQSSAIYDYLFELNTTLLVDSQKDLENFFNKYILSEVFEFERNTSGFDTNKGKYKNYSEAYALGEITRIVDKILIHNPKYSDLMRDFQEMYLKKLELIIREKKLLA